MLERRNKITTAKQFQTLISELEKKPTLARGIYRGTTHVYAFRQDWEEITRKLNSQGPPIRDCDGWLRVWKDFKFKLRKKLLMKEAEDSGMGSGKFKTIMLFPVEKAAAKLISYENQLKSNERSASVCQPPVEENQTIWEEEEVFDPGEEYTLEEVKTEDYDMMDQTLLEDEDYLPSPPAHSFQLQMSSADTKKNKRNRKSERQYELLESHSAMQEKVFYEISRTMNELKTILKDSAYCQRKMLEIEKQKLEIMQRRDEREEQLFKSEMKLKLLEIKIKTKELEALEKQSKS